MGGSNSSLKNDTRTRTEVINSSDDNRSKSTNMNGLTIHFTPDVYRRFANHAAASKRADAYSTTLGHVINDNLDDNLDNNNNISPEVGVDKLVELEQRRHEAFFTNAIAPFTASYQNAEDCRREGDEIGDVKFEKKVPKTSFSDNFFAREDLKRYTLPEVESVGKVKQEELGREKQLVWLDKLEKLKVHQIAKLDEDFETLIKATKRVEERVVGVKDNPCAPHFTKVADCYASKSILHCREVVDAFQKCVKDQTRAEFSVT